MRLPSLAAVLLAGFTLILTGCAAQPTPPTSQESVLSPTSGFTTATYRLSRGDSVRITVFQEPELSGIFLVESSGHINYPLLGRIPVVGQSVTALERRITRGLAAGYLVDPDVRASMDSFKPIFVGGEVKRPGEFPFSPGITAQHAITLAGGLTRFAAERFYLQRAGQGPEQRIRITADTQLAPGDMIFVKERLF